MYLRSKVVKLAESWLGKSETNGGQKEIVDIYNSQDKFPRNTKMQYDWEWCACTWSSLAIELGYTAIMPVEISCGQLVELAKKMGIWQENDSYLPRPGDALLYDWDDNGAGDDKGWPDHIGTVCYIDSDKKGFAIIEGNGSGGVVKKRHVVLNQKCIRGFITPKYDEEPAAKPVEKPVEQHYKTTAYLNMRSDAGLDKKILVVVPKDIVVLATGTVKTDSRGVKWFKVTAKVKGVTYTGFCSSKHLALV